MKDEKKKKNNHPFKKATKLWWWLIGAGTLLAVGVPLGMLWYLSSS